MMEDQRDVIAFLSEPSSYGPAIERVDIIETHVSLVFLAGDRAYKLKRAVKYPYLDFSTPEHRRRACEAELALNRRTAPTLYLEVRALGRLPDGKIGFAGNGAAIDWVVVMRRFDQSSLFDALAQTGRLSAPLMHELAGHIADFHAMAERRYDCGGAAAITAIAETNHRCLMEAQYAGFSRERIEELRENSLRRLAAVGGLLDRRRAEGKVRRCHGDLHLRNICLLDGKPTLFDCLEFSEALASIDVLYDLAFLLMDLKHRGLTDFANIVLNRYLDLTDEDDGLPAMQLFLSLRAVIRAHVTATAMDRTTHPESKQEMAAEARRYLDLATYCAHDPVASSQSAGSVGEASRPSPPRWPEGSTHGCCAATSFASVCSGLARKRDSQRAHIHRKCRAESTRRFAKKQRRRSRRGIR
jgi:hypothetical protein